MYIYIYTYICCSNISQELKAIEKARGKLQDAIENPDVVMSTMKETKTQRPCLLETEQHMINTLSPGVSLFLISGSGFLSYCSGQAVQGHRQGRGGRGAEA